MIDKYLLKYLHKEYWVKKKCRNEFGWQDW